MEGFKSLPKMQCFKEGGAVKSKYAGGGSCYKKGGHAESEEMSKDIAQDKSMVKRGVKQHEESLHKDEPKTKLKLKTGGKSKLVGRYKEGGSIKMKKDDSDIKDIQKIKLTKTKKAAAPSKAAIKPAMSNIAEPAPDMGAMPPPMMKKGGALKKCAEGGSLKSVDAEENPGLAKLPTNVRNKMGYAKKGGEVKKYNAGKSVSNEIARESTLGKPITSQQKEMVKEQSTKPGTLDFPYSKTTSKKYSEMKKGGGVKKYANGGMVTDEESARMPAGKLPQQIVDEEATKENVETREMVAGPLRKLKRGIMETFKSKSKTPMKHGGKAC